MLVKRDPFARQELHRSREYFATTNGNGCSWCGGYSFTKSLKAYIWHYWIEPDSVTKQVRPIKGNFCCAACFRSYHNE